MTLAVKCGSSATRTQEQLGGCLGGLEPGSSPLLSAPLGPQPGCLPRCPDGPDHAAGAPGVPSTSARTGVCYQLALSRCPGSWGSGQPVPGRGWRHAFPLFSASAFRSLRQLPGHTSGAIKGERLRIVRVTLEELPHAGRLCAVSAGRGGGTRPSTPGSGGGPLRVLPSFLRWPLPAMRLGPEPRALHSRLPTQTILSTSTGHLLQLLGS